MMRFIMGHFRRRIDERELWFIWADLPTAINLFMEKHRRVQNYGNHEKPFPHVHKSWGNLKSFCKWIQLQSFTYQAAMITILVVVNKQTLTCK